jgi:hypothetical protein
MTVQNAKATGRLVGGTTAVGVATGLFAPRGMRRMLDRRGYAQWDAEWDLVEPYWSARFHQRRADGRSGAEEVTPMSDATTTDLYEVTMAMSYFCGRG